MKNKIFILLSTLILKFVPLAYALEFKNSTDQILYIQVLQNVPNKSGVQTPPWHEVTNITIQARKHNTVWNPVNLEPNKLYGLCIRIGNNTGPAVRNSVRDLIPMHRVPGCDGLIMFNPIQQSSLNAKYDIMGPLSAGNYYIAKE